MTADARDFALEISELLFRLTTECIRVRSNETRAHESLSSLTLHVVGTDRDMAGHDADILRQHLQLVPASGDIALLLALPDRKSVVEGKSGSVRLEPGGRGLITKKQKTDKIHK